MGAGVATEPYAATLTMPMLLNSCYLNMCDNHNSMLMLATLRRVAPGLQPLAEAP